jgi:hypothetical protein
VKALLVKCLVLPRSHATQEGRFPSVPVVDCSAAHLALLVIDGVAADVNGVQIRGHARATRSPCGRCARESARVHSRYVRTLADAVIGGRPAAIRFTARRFFCSNSDCAAGTFAEQVPDLTARYARRTALLRGVLISIALALAGRPGARLAAALA